jgi:transposase
MAPANATPAPPAAELNEMHNARGLTYRQMASFYGVGLATIRRWMDEQSVPRMQSGKRLVDPSAPERTRPSRAELEEMSKTMSQKEIAEHLGFGKSTVNMWIRKYGIVTKKPDPIPEKPRTEPDQATLFRLYHDEELNLAQIGERYGHSRNWAAKLMDKYGIERRQKGWLPPVPDTHTPDPLPVPPPRTGRARQGRPPERAFLRLSETERRIVQRNVDSFLMYAQVKEAA